MESVLDSAICPVASVTAEIMKKSIFLMKLLTCFEYCKLKESWLPGYSNPLILTFFSLFSKYLQTPSKEEKKKKSEK